MSDWLFHTSKLLQEFLFPFNVAILALLVACWRLRGRGPVRGRRWLWAGLVILYLPATSLVSDLLTFPLESVHPAHPIEAYPGADVIVVLGGGTMSAQPPRYEPMETGGRLLHAARLFRAGKGNAILLTGGGGGKYEGPGGEQRSEIDDMRDVLLDMGIPLSTLLLEDQSRNTYENALHSVRILRERGAGSILLVTNAFHMRRAMDLFRAAAGSELEVVPSPVGHSSTGVRWNLRRLLPYPTNVQRSTLAIKEYAGHLAYRLMGKL